MWEEASSLFRLAMTYWGKKYGTPQDHDQLYSYELYSVLVNIHVIHFFF